MGKSAAVNLDDLRGKGPVCPYCNSNSYLSDGKEVYHGRSYGYVWVCANYPECDSYIGCHPGTTVALGRMADKELRDARLDLHSQLDPLWRRAPLMYEIEEEGTAKVKAEKEIRRIARTRTYAWLAYKLGIKIDDCHVGMFDIETCKKAAEICINTTPYHVREWYKTGKEL